AARALKARRALVVVPELPLEDAVHPAQLLLLAKLHAVVRQARTPLGGAARRHLHLAFRVERPHAALQEQVRPFAPGQLALRSEISGHVASLKRARRAASSADGSRCEVSA